MVKSPESIKTISVQVADAKRHFSDYLAKSALGDSRVIITRRGRPAAALVSIDDLRELEQLDKRQGLAAVVGKWAGFGEIADDVLAARDNQVEEWPLLAIKARLGVELLPQRYILCSGSAVPGAQPSRAGVSTEERQ